MQLNRTDIEIVSATAATPLTPQQRSLRYAVSELFSSATARRSAAGMLALTTAALLLGIGTPLLCQTGAAVAVPSAASSQSTMTTNAQAANQAAAPYTDTGGGHQNVDPAGGHLPASNTQTPVLPADPLIAVQQLAQASTGDLLPVFGRDLFQQAPSTFAPADQVPSLANYVVGPGDEILLRLWGPESFNGQLTVDSSGSIYVPQAGAIHVAGLRLDELQEQISSQLKHTFRNFDLSVNLGHLRSVQIYVVGEARRPGSYTVSSLSTLLNALFISGGPNVQGSLRNIQVRRAGKVVAELDLYDLLLHGDKSHDIPLQPDDTIFIPVVGPQVAIGGSVRRPAIYELRGETTAGALLDLAGGFAPTASTAQLSLTRLSPGDTPESSQSPGSPARVTLNVALDTAGRAIPLHDGDVLFANHVTSAIEQTVTIRGNLANPGRFPWHSGMRLTDIIPDRMSLLTSGYWQQRNALGLPVPLFEEPNSPRSDANLVANSSNSITRGALAEQQQAATSKNLATTGRSVSISIPAPSIDWSYAVVERLDPVTLKNSLLPFSLEKLLQDHDPSQNLALQPGDIVTILSQADVHVPIDEQTKYVHLEGEIKAAGVYSVGPNETLEDVVRRAGGLSSKAYLYGSSFTRESARISQQQRLDEYVSTVAAEMERSAASRTISSVNSVGDPTALVVERDTVSQLRKLRATGRIVLAFRPDSTGTEAIPPLALEDGDIFRVPSRPLTVNVIGAVYGQNVFLYDPKRRLENYLLLAGNPNQIADRKHTFIIRADGSVYSRQAAIGPWKNSFDYAQIYPGDSIVVPEKPIKPALSRQIVDYSQIVSQFALGAAAIALLNRN